jgi:hypothetical protein
MNAFEKRDSAAAESIQKSHIIDLHSGLDLKEKPAGGTSLSEALQG